MSGDKSLRDIWETTDKKSMEVMMESGGLPPSSRSSIISGYSELSQNTADITKMPKESITSSNKQATVNFLKRPQSLINSPKQVTGYSPSSQASTISNYTGLSQNFNVKNKSDDLLPISKQSTEAIYSKIPQGLFQTIQPEGLFQTNLRQKNPIASNDKNQQHLGAPHFNYLNKNSHANEEDTASLVSIWTPTNNDKLNAIKDNHDAPLISFDDPEETYPLNLSINEKNSKEYNDSDSISESELSNNYGSDDSQDEQEYTALPKEYRSKELDLSLSDSSDVTVICDNSAKQNFLKSTGKILETQKHENQSDKKTTGTYEDKKIQTVNQSNVKQIHSNKPSIGNTNNLGRRCRRSCQRIKKLSSENNFMVPKLSHLSFKMNDDILSVSHENLTIQETYSNSGRTREKRIAFKTQEVIGKKGNKTQKITYVHGKIVEDGYSSNEKTLRWNSDICNSNIQHKESALQKQKLSMQKPPQNDLFTYKFKSKNKPPVKQNMRHSNIIQTQREINNNYTFRNQNQHKFERNTKSNNFRHETKNIRKDILQGTIPKTCVTLQSQGTLPKKLPITIKDEIAEQKIKNIVSCNNKYRTQLIMKDELSWNIIPLKTEESIKNESELENKTNSTSTITCDTQTSELENNLSRNRISDETNNTSDYFICMRNLEIETKSKEYKETPVKNQTLEEKINKTEKQLTTVKCSLMKLKEAREQKKNDLIIIAKEIADLIIGCYRATDIFKSFYAEWIELRLESISILEQTLDIVSEKSKSDRIITVATVFKTAMFVASLAPYPTISLGAKIASAVGGFMAKFFGPANTKKNVEAKEFEIKETFQRDIDTTSFVYIYGVQCSSQFEETVQLINEFHGKLQKETIDSFFQDKNVLDFLHEISEYNPRNEVIFYKKLMLEYERLLNSSSSNESRAFIRVFRDMPVAIPVINLLPWRFDPDNFDNSIVRKAWEDLFSLFYNNESIDMDNFVRKVQSCLFFLKKERQILERNYKNFSNK